MKILILDRSGHTEVKTESTEEAIKELETRMNDGTLAVVESKGAQSYIRDPKELKEYADDPEAKVYVMPQLKGG
jgi:hypothetical protein